MDEQQHETMVEVLGCLAAARRGVAGARNLAAPDPTARVAVDAALAAVAVAYRIVDDAIGAHVAGKEGGR